MKRVGGIGPARARWRCAAGMVLLAGLGGCRADGATPPLPAAVAAPPVEPASAPEQPPERGAAEVAPPSDGRALWFEQGPGRAAIIARERRDHQTARALLDELLDDPTLVGDARAGAQLLRALEAVEHEDYEAAAEWFAAARS
ncbi:MAG: hypothetical protein K0V04_27240, partial [Deltaproteobacteria bacterium]|nr:hypothetical protein [Deltaproteobacteria bacterium]